MSKAFAWNISDVYRSYTVRSCPSATACPRALACMIDDSSRDGSAELLAAAATVVAAAAASSSGATGAGAWAANETGSSGCCGCCGRASAAVATRSSARALRTALICCRVVQTLKSRDRPAASAYDRQSASESAWNVEMVTRSDVGPTAR